MGGDVQARRVRLASRLGFVGVAALLVGAGLLGTAMSASAATPTVTLAIKTSAAGTCSGSTCMGLAGGDVVNVSGAGFSAGQEASTLECNDDPLQPVIVFLGNAVPVSCTAIVIVSTSASGTFGPSAFTIKSGTTGPPDSIGVPTCTPVVTPTTVIPAGCTTTGNPQTDAAAYPCPPTPAQVTAGDECVLAIGDIKGERAIGDILFGSETAPSSTLAPGSSTSGSTGSSSTTSTTSSTGSTSSTTSTTSSTGSTSSTTSTTSSTGSTSSTTTTTAAPSSTSSTTTTTAAPSSTSSTTSTTAAPSSTSSTTSTTAATTTAITGPYELYCPGTPVGDIVLNDAVTSAMLSPAAPTAGQSFTVTNYQTMVAIPNSLASAAAAIQPNLSGSATAQIDASGATPATTPEGPLDFNVTIPSPIPTAGVPLSLPSTPATISGFTATSPNITIQEDSAASLSLTVSGSALALTCTAYPNDSVTPSGIVTSAPTATPISPVIAVAGGGSSATTVPVAPTTTTKAPTPGGTPTTAPTNLVVTKPSSSLAFTGVGPGIGMLGVVGGALILLGFALLVLVDAPRRAVSRLVFLGPATWRRVQAGDMAERLGNLNPMRWRRARSEGVPDTKITTNDGVADTTITTHEDVADATITTTAPPETGGLSRFSVTRVRGVGDRFSRVPAASRDIAQTTARHAVRTAQWLLGR